MTLLAVPSKRFRGTYVLPPLGDFRQPEQGTEQSLWSGVPGEKIGGRHPNQRRTFVRVAFEVVEAAVDRPGLLARPEEHMRVDVKEQPRHVPARSNAMFP